MVVVAPPRCCAAWRLPARGVGSALGVVAATSLRIHTHHLTPCLPACAPCSHRFLEQQCLLSELEGMLHEAQCSSSSSGREADQHHHSSLPEEAAASLARHMQAAAVIQRLQLPEGAQAAAPQKGGFGALKPAAAAAAAADGTSSRDAALSGGCASCLIWPRQSRDVGPHADAGSTGTEICCLAPLPLLADMALADQLGSRQHVLGVTPQQLRQACLPSRKAAQVGGAAVAARGRCLRCS
jgi:hypothetical protein